MALISSALDSTGTATSRYDANGTTRIQIAAAVVTLGNAKAAARPLT